MWPETSSVKAVNLVKKSVTVTEIIFPKGLFFIGAPCTYINTHPWICYLHTYQTSSQDAIGSTKSRIPLSG